MELLDAYESLNDIIKKEKLNFNKPVKRYFKLRDTVKYMDLSARMHDSSTIPHSDNDFNLRFVSIKLKEQVYCGRSCIGIFMREVSEKIRQRFAKIIQQQQDMKR